MTYIVNFYQAVLSFPPAQILIAVSFMILANSILGWLIEGGFEDE
jgi:hypothetical protein